MPLLSFDAITLSIHWLTLPPFSMHDPSDMWSHAPTSYLLHPIRKHVINSSRVTPLTLFQTLAHQEARREWRDRAQVLEW